jgi:UDP-N-acetylmuramoyl-tripeptide--D-alanyl-D-alanine ligase
MGMTPDKICAGLLAYKPIEKRWEVEEIGNLKFINDSYNANPESMKASVKTFVELYKNPVIVLGNMGELGEDEVLYHRQVGEYISEISHKNVKFLTVGNLAEEIAKVLALNGFDPISFDTTEQAARYIVENLHDSYTIFLKASRSMKFEQILEYVRRGIVEL